MLGRLAFRGRTSWMNWLRRPRLKRAVHSVAVLTVMSWALVSGVNGMGMKASVGRELVVDDDAGVFLALARDEGGEVGRRAATRHGALRQQLLFHVGHGEHLLQVFRDLVQHSLRR